MLYLAQGTKVSYDAVGWPAHLGQLVRVHELHDVLGKRVLRVGREHVVQARHGVARIAVRGQRERGQNLSPAAVTWR